MKMQFTSPFNEGDLEGYMNQVLLAVGDKAPLENGSETHQARMFLERLAQRGLLRFMEESAQAPDAPEQLEEALRVIRDSGRSNMLDHPVVARLAREYGFAEVAAWIEAYPTAYVGLMLNGGVRPLQENFAGPNKKTQDIANQKPATTNGRETPCAD